MRLTVILLACLALGACASASPDRCAGWAKETPSPATRTFIVANDRAFAGQVVAHNQTGHAAGCW